MEKNQPGSLCKPSIYEINNKCCWFLLTRTLVLLSNIFTVVFLCLYFKERMLYYSHTSKNFKLCPENIFLRRSRRRFLLFWYAWWTYFYTVCAMLKCLEGTITIGRNFGCIVQRGRYNWFLRGWIKNNLDL